MTTDECVCNLRAEIDNTLLPLLGDRCVLYDVPYYKNIGDVLIWEGELCFLEEHSIRLLDMASYNTCNFPELDEEVTVLFQGGGNIGDLYHEHVDFLLSLVRAYPDNRIIVLSQTVYYKNEQQFYADFMTLSSHQNLYFAARDRFVYKKIERFFGDRALLLPDMAFYISSEHFTPYVKQECRGLLRIVRKDCERSMKDIEKERQGVELDWPVFDQKIRLTTLKNTLYDRLYKIPFLRYFLRQSWNHYAYRIFRVTMIREGVEFISPYRTVMSERLHGCILAMLLGKEVLVVDNSYQKNRHFYETWLSEVDSVHFYT